MTWKEVGLSIATSKLDFLLDNVVGSYTSDKDWVKQKLSDVIGLKKILVCDGHNADPHFLAVNNQGVLFCVG